MDNKKEKRIETKLSKIIKDKKQLSVRIPSKMVSEFAINTKMDGFLWIIEEEDLGIFLKGTLVKGIFKDERKK